MANNTLTPEQKAFFDTLSKKVAPAPSVPNGLGTAPVPQPNVKATSLTNAPIAKPYKRWVNPFDENRPIWDTEDSFVYNLLEKIVERGKFASVQQESKYGTKLYERDIPYDSMPESLSTSDGEVISEQSGDCVVLVLPYQNHDTFNFSSRSSNLVSNRPDALYINQEHGYTADVGITVEQDAEGTNIPINTDSDIMALGQPLFLDNKVLSLAVRSAKSSHQDSLHILLKEPFVKTTYGTQTILNLCNPGDWIVCWMFNNTSDAQKLRKKIKNASDPARLLPQCNDFYSGLKFIGKIEDVRLNESVDAHGTWVSTCDIQANAFSELDGIIYYDPQLSSNVAEGTYFISAVSRAINNELSGLVTDVNYFIATILTAFFGKKLPTNDSLLYSPNQLMRIPKPIHNLLYSDQTSLEAAGIEEKSSENYTYLDILEVKMGIEHYFGNYIPNYASNIIRPFKLDNVISEKQSDITIHIPEQVSFYETIRASGAPLQGFVEPFINPFAGVPLWSIIQAHSLPQINEMYTCLRSNEYGEILPHLIIRQIPFNNNVYAETSPIEVTAFRTLPRWLMDPALVIAYNTGKTNALRTNYVHVNYTGALGDPNLTAAYRASTIPKMDHIDISRNGLRPRIEVVHCYKEGTEQGSTWSELVADRTIGSHLKLSGTMSTIGIQEPIAIGDNLQFDNFVYHIEAIEHKIAINPVNGIKQFSTNLALSNGIPAERIKDSIMGLELPELATREVSTTAKVYPNGDVKIELQNISQTSTIITHRTVPSVSSTEDDPIDTKNEGQQ